MKKLFSILIISFFLVACNEVDTTTEKKLENLGDKIDTTAERIGDSLKSKGGRLVEKIDNAIDRNRDSIKRDTTID